MKHVKLILSMLLLFAIGCQETTKENSQDLTDKTVSFEQEKAAILKTINDETKAAFTRDYNGWKDKWVHGPAITKTYINFTDNSFSESLGWEKISGFVKTFIEEHPEPEPVPEPLDDIEVRLYGNGAWVVYEQQDSLRGLKRETRLMEKIGGQWKIAGMQTTIYGFNKKEQDAETTLIKTIDNFNKAFKEGDVEMIETMVSENYLHTNGNSKSIGKTQWLDYLHKREREIKSGELEVVDYAMDEREIEIFGNLALVTGKIVVSNKRNNEIQKNEYRITNVWKNEYGNWKRAGFHDGKIK